MTGETRFVDEVYSEYRRLVGVCDYLVIVAHVSAHPPAAFDYELDPDYLSCKSSYQPLYR